VPYYLDAGSAQAFLDALQCSAGGTIPERVDVLAVTKAGSSKLATVSDSSLASTTSTPVPATARIVNVAGLVTADTKSVLSLNIPGNAGTMLSFTPDYATASSQAVGASSISLPTVAATDLKVTALVLGLDVAAIALDLSTGINNALPAVKANILDPLYKTLGAARAGLPANVLQHRSGRSGGFLPRSGRMTPSLGRKPTLTSSEVGRSSEHCR
jgi:hypothetical protein